ncbi:MAG: ATP-dependent 6-phosphofructokinase [Saprospiraceae bacterium]|nr:ATP-dependent 6-phosphofructokinase [Saprospiraceae bacterium]
MKQKELAIKSLGPCRIKSPLKTRAESIKLFHFVEDSEQVIFDVVRTNHKENGKRDKLLTMEMAGPREKIFFDPSKTTVAIVTCGGLCPGINDVVRSLVMAFWYRYGVRKILGVQYGYQGFIPEHAHPFIELTPKIVSDIHQFGGTILGSSRGEQDVEAIVDCLERHGINILYTIGGDGTLHGANEIHREIEKRGLKIGIAGIPKTIDNDINHIEKSFGFETSFTIASPIIRDAHMEARGAYNGVAIVKLMGRDSGFIAANAALSMPEVNLVLVPEIEFDLHGKRGLLEVVRQRLGAKHHCVIVVAEGAGQRHFEGKRDSKDASGNVLHHDIGIFLKKEISNYLNEVGMDSSVKYIDPSYIIRSAPANPSDSIFCNKLGLHGAHAGMAGKTNFVVGRRNNKFVHLPVELVIAKRKKIDVRSDLWLNVLETTGQPVSMKNETEGDLYRKSMKDVKE